MNKISKNVYDLLETYRKAGVESPFNAQEVIEELTENSYKNNALENLVNIYYGEESTLNISNLRYIDDYEIITKSFTDEDGNEYDEYDEEEYLNYLKEKAECQFKGYTVVERDDNGKICYDLLDENKAPYYECISEAEALEQLEQLKEEYIENEPAFEDLDCEYHEIYWNTVFQPDYDIDVESAYKAGLGVLELNETGDRYLFLRGCGMDLSFQFVKYYAYAQKALPLRYLDKLEWTKMNSGKEEFKQILTCLGVDISKLSNL